MIVEKGIKDELRWFYEARFGMFVHFGLYSLLGRGEWVMYDENIPRHEYEKLADEFNPYLFDADEWVKLAQDAGAKYITLTTKHHDGFCLFDSALTDYKITNTSFGRDLTAEIIDACHRRDMRIVLYYSQPDWHHPNFVHNKGAFKDLDNPPSDNQPDWDAYLKYYMGQVEELCTKYGRIDGIWFDGSHKTVEEWKGREIYQLIKKHQPNAVVNDRARCGDLFTPERSLPEDLTEFLFEACESISPTAWGYMGDTPSYSVPYLISSLEKMVVHGGNYLLNVGPKPDGSIPEKQAEVLLNIGKWLNVHGKAIYKTEPVMMDSPKHLMYQKYVDIDDMQGQWGATKAGTSLYFHCYSWPSRDRLTLPGIDSEPKAVKLIGSGDDIEFTQNENGVQLSNLPCTPPDGMPQVFELIFDAPPVVREVTAVKPEKPVISISPDGDTQLCAKSAILEGYGYKGHRIQLVVDNNKGVEYISEWHVPEQQARWQVDCSEKGDYRILVAYENGSGKDLSGAVIGINAAANDLQIDIAQNENAKEINKDTGFSLVEAGVVSMPKGRSDITVFPAKLKWGYVFTNIEKVVLEKI